MEVLKIAVFASHGGSNLQAILDACKNGTLNAQVVTIISNNSKSHALVRGKRENIPSFHLSSHTHPTEKLFEEAVLAVLEKYSANLIVLAGYMKKLAPRVLHKYKGKILNIHPSLLPKYGGKGMFGQAVHEAVLKNGDQITGVTITLIEKRAHKDRCHVLLIVLQECLRCS